MAKRDYGNYVIPILVAIAVIVAAVFLVWVQGLRNDARSSLMTPARVSFAEGPLPRR